MGLESLTKEEMIREYLPDVKLLMRYLPWLESKIGGKVTSMYTNDGTHDVMPVPQYDSQLLALIKALRNIRYINNTYVHTIAKYRLKTPEDELRFIHNAVFTQMLDLWNIMGKYVIKGMTKGIYWSAGVEEGIFCAVIKKMRSLIESESGKRL